MRNNFPIRAAYANYVLNANMHQTHERQERDRLFVWVNTPFTKLDLWFPLYRNQLSLSALSHEQSVVSAEHQTWSGRFIRHKVRCEPTTPILNEVCSGGWTASLPAAVEVGVSGLHCPLPLSPPTALLLGQNHFQAALQPVLPLSSLCVGGRELSRQRNSLNSNLHSCSLSILERLPRHRHSNLNMAWMYNYTALCTMCILLSGELSNQ